MADLVVAVNIAGEQSVSAATDAARSSLAGLRSEAESTGSVFGSLADTFQHAIVAASGFLVFDRIADGFRALNDAAIGLSATMQQTRVSFEVMTGSAELADSFLRQLAKFAADTPFEFPDLLVGAQRLKAMGFGVTELIPLLTDIGNVGSAFGGSTTDSINRIITALGQMAAKTKVQTEEMRQLSEVGIPAWEILAKAAGQPIPVMQEMVRQGQVASDFFIKAFHDFSTNNFGDQMARQMQTFNGALTTVRDNLRLAIVDGFAPFFATLTQGVVAIADFTRGDTFNFWTGVVMAAMQNASNALLGFLSGLQPLQAAIGEFFNQLAQGNVSEAMAGLGENLMTALNNMIQMVFAFGDAMFGAGTNLMSELGNGIIEGASNAVTQAVNFVADLIASFLIGQSPPPEGPLNSIVTGGQGVITAWADGLLAGGAAVTAAAENISLQAIKPLQEGMKELNLAFSLEEGRAKFQGALGDFENLESVSRDVTGQVKLIGDAMRDLDRESANIKFQMQDLKDIFDDQLDVLKDQIQAVKDRYDAEDQARNQLKLEQELEELGLKQQENAAKGNREEIARIKGEQEMLKFKTQEATIQSQLEDLRKQEKDGKDVGAKRDILNYKMQELELAKQLAGQSDKEALARIASAKDELKGRQDELSIEDRRAKIQEQMDITPLEKQLQDMKKTQQDMLDPLEQQIKSIERQKFGIQQVQDSWRDLQEEIRSAMQLQKDFDTDAARAEAERKRGEAEAKKGAKAAKTTDPLQKAIDKAGAGFAINTGGAPRLPTIDIQSAADTAASKAKEAGMQMGAQIGQGIQEWFHSHALAIFGGLVGLVAAGPVGAAIGAALGEGITNRFKELGIEDEVAAGFGRLVDKIRGFGTEILNILTTIGQVIQGNWSSDESIDPVTNAFGNFAVMLRDQVIPAVMGAVTWIKDNFIPGLQALFQFVQPLLPVIAGIAAAFAVFTTLTTIVGIIGGVATAFGAIAAVAGAVATNIGLMFAILEAGGSVFSIIGTVATVLVGILGGPLVVTIGAIAIAVGVLTAAWLGNWGDIQGKTAAVVSWVQGIPGMLSGVWSGLQSGWQNIATAAGNAWKTITSVVGGAISAVTSTVGSWISSFTSAWSTFWSNVGNFLTTFWNGTVIPFLQGAMEIIYNIFLVGLGLWWSIYGVYITNIYNTIVAAFTLIQEFWNTWWPVVSTFFTEQLTLLWTNITTMWTNITTTTQTMWTAISTWFMDTFWTPLTTMFTTGLTNLWTFITTTWQNITEATTTAWNAITAFFLDVFWNPLLQLVTDISTKILNFIKDTWGTVSTETTRIWNDIKNFLINTIWNPLWNETTRIVGQLAADVKKAFEDLANQAKSWATDMIGNFFEGLKEKGEEVLDWVKGFVDKIKEMFKGAKGLDENSPSAVLRDVGRNAVEGLRLGLEDKAAGLMASAQNIVSGVTGTFSSVSVAVPGNVRDWITQAVHEGGFPESWIEPMTQLAMLESGGNPGAQNPTPVGNGEHATGLLQTIPSTFSSNAIAGHTNILNPVDNAIASMNYIARGGKFWLGDPWNVLRYWQQLGGYARGGILPEDMIGLTKNGYYQLHGGEGVFNKTQMRAMGLMVNDAKGDQTVHNHYTFVNHGVLVGQDADDWLVNSLKRVKREGRMQGIEVG